MSYNSTKASAPPAEPQDHESKGDDGSKAEVAMITRAGAGAGAGAAAPAGGIDHLHAASGFTTGSPLLRERSMTSSSLVATADDIKPRGDDALATALRGDGVRFEHVKVYPEGVLPSTMSIQFRKPDFGGADGFTHLKDHLYSRAESKSAGTGVTFDVRVQDGQIGWYTSRGGTLHLLKTGRHYKPPGALDSAYQSTSLNDDEVHLPPPAPGVLSTFHIIRCQPGEVVSAIQGGRPIFLEASTDSAGLPQPGFHVIDNDRTFRVLQRAAVSRPIIRAGTCFILNVAPGFVCKAMLNRSPLLLGAGTHHVNVSGFSIPGIPAAGDVSDADAARVMVSINDPIISHLTIHCIRVLPGHKAKVALKGKPLLLESRAEPYLFNDATLVVDPDPANVFVAASTKYIQHGTRHQVRLDRGEGCLLWINNRPIVLGSSAVFGERAVSEYGIDIPSEDHTLFDFDSPNIRCAKDRSGRPKFVNLGTERVVQHGTILIIRVVQGELCRIWMGSRPVLLQPRDEPWVYNDLSVRLASEDKDGYPAFVKQSELVISHGVHHSITVPSGKLCRVWLEGEARVLGGQLSLDSMTDADEIRRVSTLDPSAAAGASGADFGGDAGGDDDAGADAGTDGDVGTARGGRAKTKRADAVTGTGRVFSIESSKFRLADEATDGYGPWVSQSEKVILHGPLAVVTVEDGEVAVVRNQGRREALRSGRFVLRAPQQVFERMLYIGVRTTAPEDIVSYDAGRLPIRIAFTSTFEITDAAKAAQYQGEGGLDHFIGQVCHSVLRSCINSTHILDMGKGGELKKMKEGVESERVRKQSALDAAAAASTASGAAAGAGGASVATSDEGHSPLEDMYEEPTGFAQQVHVAFEAVHDTMDAQLSRVGVSLIDLSIQDWSIEDPKVVSQLESLAMQNVEAQVSNARIESNQRAAMLNAEGEANAAVAKAKGEAQVRQASIDADNSSKLSMAQAALDAARIEAEATRVRAEAEADAIIRKAEADAKATEMRGSAEAGAKRAALEALALTPAPEWMRQMQEACAGVLAGASVTVTPNDLGQLMGLMSSGSPLFAGMRSQGVAALGGATGFASAKAGGDVVAGVAATPDSGPLDPARSR